MSMKRGEIRRPSWMTRILAVLVAEVIALSTMLVIASPALAEETQTEAGGITYTLELDDETGTVAIDEMSDPAEDSKVEIPATFTIDGGTYTVTSMNLYSFSKLPHVTAVTLPDTLTQINGSFRCFEGVTEITIPGSVETFGATFQSMQNLQTITFGEGVKELSSEAGSMVYGCKNLTTIVLPSTLEKINANAAFSDAKALTNINLPNDVTFSDSGVSYFARCTSLTSITLPESMSAIPMYMFQGCTALQSVTTTGTIESIGNGAFSGCTALTEVPSLSSVTTIGSYAFNECTALTGPVDLSKVTSLGSYAFYQCKSLEGTLDLSGLTVIPSRAFSYVTAKVTALNPGLTKIGDWGFVWTDLTQVDLPDTLESIGDYGCFGAQLKDPLCIPDSVTSLGKGAFDSTDVEEFIVGSGIKSVGSQAFPETATRIVLETSPDDVTFADGLPTSSVYIFKEPSVADGNYSDGENLQKQIDSAESGATIPLDGNIGLGATLTIPEDKSITLQANGEGDVFLFADPQLQEKSFNLISVPEGSSLTLRGADGSDLVLFGKYGTGSAVEVEGSLELGQGSAVRKFTCSKTGTGVIDVRGADASITISGGEISENVIGTGTETSGVASAGAVRVQGAQFVMTSGSISNNDASQADYLRSTGGIYLCDGAHGSLSGGKISNNKGVRGAAVFLVSDDAGKENRASLTQSGGEISGNTSERNQHSATGYDPSGAVHVENNAEYSLTGGKISGNTTAGNGGGVCVVDGNLQNGQNEYGTAFKMDGGEISDNHATYGGGVYSYTNGVVLNAGKISGNVASNTGGGVYSEGNSSYYGTIRVNNALVTENSAVHGGGLYFCATGSGVISSTRGIAVLDNAAKDDGDRKAAGDDVVFTKMNGEDERYQLCLTERLLGGGALTWVRDGAVYLPAANSHPQTDTSTPRYDAANPVVVDGADLHAGQKSSLALKAVSDSRDGEELARSRAKLFITGNTAVRGGGIGSNGGVIGGDDKVTQVKVTKVWDDGGNADGSRPGSVTVHLFNGDSEIDSAVLSDENGWSWTFSDLPTDDPSYTITEDSVDGYTSSISGGASDGFVVTNTHVPGTPPTGPGTIDVPVVKVWADQDDADGSRPGSVTVHLFNGDSEIDSAVLSGENGWRWTFSDLPKDGTYTITEDSVDGYTSSISGDASDGFVVTNTHVPGTPPTGPDEPSPSLPNTGDASGTAARHFVGIGIALLFVSALLFRSVRHGRD